MIIKQCMQCKKEFQVFPSRKAKYCSNSCYFESKVKYLKFKNADGFYERKCEICKKLSITKYPPQGRYCKKCAGVISKKTKPALKGNKSKAWKGGRTIDGYGYVKLNIPNHPLADKTNYVREHIVNIVNQIGVEEFVKRGGVTHHIDGDKQNNDISNLWACTAKENINMNYQLLEIAFSLVRNGYIVFNIGQYSCPLLSDGKGESSSNSVNPKL